MPPRRSCFVRRLAYAGQVEYSFNATTAFLLLSPPRSPPAAAAPVSMPPRRSCFLAVLVLLALLALSFQCHHGVPASLGERIISSRPSRFNATTAFLLQNSASDMLHLLEMFQCHHGVPASPPPFG